ncbi:hypothetical protein Tco_0704462 [Tanacetum coccineum]|uniref:Uncharacterized protein n=1 Tax=Tanacetum coccineum TaxID=301880 RepID=A0ABQ4Y232_9ASTR
MSTTQTKQQSLLMPFLRRYPPCLERVPKLQTAEDLQGDALLHYDAEMELMNLILLSIPNDIYNFMDACTSHPKDIGNELNVLIEGNYTKTKY